MTKRPTHSTHRYYFEYLREVRLTKGMTLTEVAHASRVGNDVRTQLSLSAISKIEAGLVAQPSIGTVVKLARGYGVPLEAFERFFR